MSTQSTERQRTSISPQQTSIARVTLTITLVITLGFSGLLTITFAGWAGNEPGERILADPATLHSTVQLASQPTPIPQLSPTLDPPTPTTPTTPNPPSTGLLPPILRQAIATLRAQNRLFFSGNAHLPEIALTFDDGPNPYYTPQILAILQQYNVKATFFCVGYLVADYPALVQQEYAAGHVIGDHSWSHPNLALLPPATVQLQISRTSDAIKAAIGVRPTFFRPPYGRMSVPELTQAYHDGLTTVIWNDEGRDWARPGVDVIIQRILGLARNGAIILMHDGGGDRSQTVAALPFIIAGLQQRGFQFVTLQQMVTNVPQQQGTDNFSGSVTANGSPLLLLPPDAWKREPGI